jgi:hypothetical protein
VVSIAAVELKQRLKGDDRGSIVEAKDLSLAIG